MRTICHVQVLVKKESAVDIGSSSTTGTDGTWNWNWNEELEHCTNRNDVNEQRAGAAWSTGSTKATEGTCNRYREDEIVVLEQFDEFFHLEDYSGK